MLKPLRRRWWFRLLLMVLLVYAGWCAALLYFQTQLIFPGAYNRNSAAIASPDEPVTTIQGVAVWHAGPRLDTEPPARVPGVALVFHGNDDTSSNTVKRYAESRLLARAGWAVLAPEYPGFAGRPGTPSQRQIVQESAAIARWVRQRVGPEVPIIYVGYSLGGGVAAAVAQSEPPAGLILRSTFTAISDYSWQFGVPPLLVLHPFNNRAALARAAYPVLLTHGTRDQIVPLAHGRALSRIPARIDYAEFEGDHFRYADERGYAVMVDRWLSTNFPARTDGPASPDKTP